MQGILLIYLCFAVGATEVRSAGLMDECLLPQLAYHLVKFEGRESDFPIPAYATAQWKLDNQKKIIRVLVLDTETLGARLK